MTDPLHITVVTLTHNSSHVLPRFLRGLKNGGHTNFDLVVVDNHSSPNHVGAMNILLGEFSSNVAPVTMVWNDRNLFWVPVEGTDGYGNSMNGGLTLAGGPYIIGMNPDCYGDVQEGWMARALRCYRENEPLIGVMGAVLTGDDALIDHAGGIGHSNHLNQCERWTDQFPEMRSVEWNTGAFHFYSKDLLEQIGYMKIGHPYMASDRWICAEAERLGRKNFCCSIRLIHVQGQSTEGRSRFDGPPPTL